MTNFSDTVTCEKIQMDLMRYQLSEILGATSLEDLEINLGKDFLSNRIQYRLEFSLLNNKIADDTYKCYFTYKEPQTWFEHLKKDKAPKWFLRKFPVKYNTIKKTRTVNFTRYAQYPKANIKVRNNQYVYLQLGEYERIEDKVTEVYND